MHARVFFLVPLLAPSLSMAQDTPDAQATVQQANERIPDRRRLLTLEDGRILRVRSRFENDRWEERVGPRWEPLEGTVKSARLEREVVAEAKRMRAEISGGDSEGEDPYGQRVALATWMAAEGLYREALDEIDDVLADRPDDTAALGFLRGHAMPLELPEKARTNRVEEIRALIKAGSGGTPAVREAAVWRLEKLGGIVNLEQLVKAELKTMQRGRRAFAAHVARRLFPGDFLRELSDRALLDGARPVREAASLALLDAKDVTVIAPAINALDSKHATLRANAAEALGNMGYLAAVEPLMASLSALQSGSAPSGTRANIYLGNQTAYVMDYDVEIAQGASIADPIVAVQDSGSVLDVRSVAQISRTVEITTIIGSLVKLTGDTRKTGNEWLDWWADNQSDWRSRDHATRGTRVTNGR